MTVRMLMRPILVITFAATMLAGSPSSGASPSPYEGFESAQPVSIEGYDGGAMEPFVSPDGRYLFFNNPNTAAHTTLRYATRVNDSTFVYRGEVAGANDPTALSAVANLDDAGTFYFISTRSYRQTLSTVYSGVFAGGRVSGVGLVPGVSTSRLGLIDFDVEVSAEGDRLYVSQGTFTGGPAPSTAQLFVFRRSGNRFVEDPQADALLTNVNATAPLVYAPAISSDGRELFFTAKLSGESPAIYRALRSQDTLPFSDVQPVAAAVGFVEAPALSRSGHLLYFHRRVGNSYAIFVARRLGG